MNWKLWLCVASGVLVIHIGVLMLWVNFQPRPKLRAPGPHAFTARAQPVVDPNTGESLVIREFTVSTKFATPEPGEKAEGKTKKAE